MPVSFVDTQYILSIIHAVSNIGVQTMEPDTITLIESLTQGELAEKINAAEILFNRIGFRSPLSEFELVDSKVAVIFDAIYEMILSDDRRATYLGARLVNEFPLRTHALSLRYSEEGQVLINVAQHLFSRFCDFDRELKVVAAGLTFLLAGNQQNKEFMINHGVINSLVDMLGQGTDDEDRAVLQGLTQLINNAAINNIFIKAGGVTKAIAACHSIVTLKTAALMLVGFASAAPGNKSIILEEGGVAVLCKKLKEVIADDENNNPNHNASFSSVFELLAILASQRFESQRHEVCRLFRETDLISYVIKYFQSDSLYRHDCVDLIIAIATANLEFFSGSEKNAIIETVLRHLSSGARGYEMPVMMKVLACFYCHDPRLRVVIDQKNLTDNLRRELYEKLEKHTQPISAKKNGFDSIKNYQAPYLHDKEKIISGIDKLLSGLDKEVIVYQLTRRNLSVQKEACHWLFMTIKNHVLDSISNCSDACLVESVLLTVFNKFDDVWENHIRKNILRRYSPNHHLKGDCLYDFTHTAIRKAALAEINYRADCDLLKNILSVILLKDILTAVSSGVVLAIYSLVIQAQFDLVDLLGKTTEIVLANTIGCLLLFIIAIGLKGGLMDNRSTYNAVSNGFFDRLLLIDMAFGLLGYKSLLHINDSSKLGVFEASAALFASSAIFVKMTKSTLSNQGNNSSRELFSPV